MSKMLGLGYRTLIGFNSENRHHYKRLQRSTSKGLTLICTVYPRPEKFDRVCSISTWLARSICLTS